VNYFYLKYIAPLSFVLLLAGLIPLKSNKIQEPARDEDWPVYGGNKAGNRYSPLTQINASNIKNLRPAWSYNTGDNTNPASRGIDLQCQPIVIKGIMYAVTPRMKLFALDAATGKELWKFDPFVNPVIKPTIHAVRGVTYWEDGADKRIIYGVGPLIFEVDATTGHRITTFGNNGTVEMHIGLKDNEVFGKDPDKYWIRSTSPGAVYKDIFIIGSSVSEGPDAPPGYIQAFNVRTGKLAWVFHTVPLPGEYGYETWAKDAYKKIGGANDWSGLVIDEKRGIAFVSTGSPAVDFYGGARPGKNLFSDCVIALNAETGKRLWHFQTIHHDMWDRDLPSPANLITVKHNGRMVDAVAQATKDGLMFLFDRVTGKPLFPVKEIPVTVQHALPGEHPWPTQPVPVLPAPFSLQEVTENNITNRTPEAHKYVLNQYRHSLHGTKYMPPNLQGTLFLGFGGGAEWGGTAADPDGIIYVNANNMLWWLKMTDVSKLNSKTTATHGSVLFNSTCAPCHGINGAGSNGGDGAQAFPVLTNIGQRLSRAQINTVVETGRGRMPSFQNISKSDRDAIVDFLLRTEKNGGGNYAARVAKFKNYPYSPPYLNNGTTQFRDNENYPALKTPWGTLNAINLNTGKFVWQVPLGEYPELVKQGHPNTGTENHGGMVITANGLLFIAATYDENLRAFDTKTGKVIWQYKLPAGGFATPITYMVNGKQYVVIAAGGSRYGLKPGGSYVAFALPD
jgi:quinoprotein glucose dehydrogenase